MKKFVLNSFLFLGLVLMLSSGSSYLALNQVSKSTNDDEQKMTVALVNEDQGGTFNSKKYAFGNEFVKSIEKDNEHDWYIVSRGVAESGFKNNLYNMIIIIPNDFTEKALSMNDKNPEKITLNYKINASGNSSMKARAEKTASSILEDFNRRIIDVYFASVIGNLQKAQDNVAELVRKERNHTNIYNHDIHQPLSGFTNQFATVKDQTKVSTDAFKGLEDILQNYQSSFVEGAKATNAYQTNFLDFQQMKNAHETLAKGFADQLTAFDSSLNAADVQQNINRLVETNQAIYNQFHFNSMEDQNIFLKSEALKMSLKSTLETIDSYEQELTKKLENETEENIAKKLAKQMKDGVGNSYVSLNQIFDTPDKIVQKTIKSQIDKLQTLKREEIDDLNIDESVKSDIKMVIKVTNQFNREFQYQPQPSNGTGLPLANLINKVKKDLTESGIILSDNAAILGGNIESQNINAAVPELFRIHEVTLTLPNGQTNVFKVDGDQNNVTFDLPVTEKGNITVNIKISLKDENAKIDLFQPVAWEWKIIQKHKNTEAPEPSDPSDPLPPEEQQPDPEALNMNENSNSESTQDDSNDENTNEPPVEREDINNVIYHKVMSQLISDPANTFMKSLNESIRDYQKTAMLYELYFGKSISDLANGLEQRSLGDMAAEDSLYYLFHKQDIVEAISDYMAGKITEDVRAETEDLKNKIAGYKQLVQKTQNHSDEMALLVQQATIQAEELNHRITNTLQRLEAWREASLKLQNANSEIQAGQNKEQSAVLSLDDQLQTLLATSQSLADQSENVLISTDSVYKTFDAIDKQADNIVNSGDTLVKKAQKLSNDLTNKLLKDQEFADNFGQVLANSRIGDRPNENLLNFLSNPVQTKNSEVKVVKDTFIPYYLVLICFILALFSAYVIATSERKRLIKDDFSENRTLVWKNTPITWVTAGIGVIEGIIIGLLSGSFIDIPQEKYFQWIGLISLIMFTMVLAGAYLLRQLKMIGMFLLLGMLSLYVLLTETLGLNFDKQSLASTLQELSPLQYIEKLLLGFVDDAKYDPLIITILVGTAFLSLVGHLFVINGFTQSKEARDEAANPN
ncbi:type VII secretion protein EsaA [Aeribacillus pallidus]|uniref:Type VII secretion system accessory factor EsaA n=1 Tax=Aeribacillus pallidus TaxID=33936 RepID=A0A223E1S3_9BACI|nr:type VII secretion protein EsaA [Aeribacillus pallidus]ASS89163.1 type VII secretion protein EsaA [Aeribacillus pallidus]